MAARAADLAVVAVIAGIGWIIAGLVGLSGWPSAMVALLLSAAYELAAVSFARVTPGKRLLGVEPISVWESRELRRGEALRRAVFVDVQLLFPPLGIRNLAWLLWDPARQCLHDRKATIVIAGRSRPGQKL